MRRNIQIVVYLCLGLIPGGQAFSQTQSQVITTVTPQEVAKIIQSAGYRASVISENGSTFVKSSMSGGVTVFVDFAACNNNNCGSLVFNAVWNDPSLNVEFANAWNLGWRFAKAYIDKNGYFHFAYDVNLDGGITADNLKQDAALFDYLIGQLRKFPGK